MHPDSRQHLLATAKESVLTFLLQASLPAGVRILVHCFQMIGESAKTHESETGLKARQRVT